MRATAAVSGVLLSGACLAGPAAAVTLNVDAETVRQGVVSTPMGAVSGADLAVTFAWTATPIEAWVSFTSDTPFDVTFDSFAAPVLDDEDRSALILQRLDGPDGTPVAAFSVDGPASGTVGGPSEVFLGEARTIVTGVGGQDVALKPDSDTAIFEALAAGSYRLGIWDSSTPGEATAAFTVSAVPLPPAILGAVGAFALAAAIPRRRRAT